ncbi:alpha/beta hydrolase [Bosea sp. CCNWLW174]|uniref:alpha/beta hydrolase n=1 Tax=unclassified Bosea (in: a-proteobacteria) TaxID=2653178 RepID=UPI00301463A1
MGDPIHQTVTVAGRSLHCLRLGSGPSVVLLHESPRSSAVLLPLANALANRFTVFAVDTPGYGASDPLPESRPTIDDFADAIAASLQALGLTGFAVYGTHTGATIAASLVRRHPGLVSGAVLDGYPVFTRAEQDLNAYHYFPNFEPRWDGSHVAALWSRVRDQYSFFPWWQPGRDSRIPRDPPALANHHAAVRDILSAADYAAGYNAAFRTDGRAALAGITRPAHLICREDDTLFPHLGRLGAVASPLTIERMGVDRAAWAARIGTVFAQLANAAPPLQQAGQPGKPEGALTVLAPGLLARAYDTGVRAAPPLVLLPDLPGQARDWADLARREARRRPVLALELPGAGRSLAMLDGSPAAMTTFLAQALDAAGLGTIDLAGAGLGGLLAQRLAQARPGGRVLLLDPPPARSFVPALPSEPDWHGGFLMAHWYEAREAMLFRPANSRRSADARSLGPGIDLAAIQRRFVAGVCAAPELIALGTALAGEAAIWPEHTDRSTDVVLHEGDPDNACLASRLGAARAQFRKAPLDGLIDAAAILLGHGNHTDGSDE